jgi:hypothetical protein
MYLPTAYYSDSVPKHPDITGSHTQAYNLQATKYINYIIGGIITGTIVDLGTVFPGSLTLTYIYTLAETAFSP